MASNLLCAGAGQSASMLQGWGKDYAPPGAQLTMAAPALRDHYNTILAMYSLGVLGEAGGGQIQSPQ